MKQSMSVMVSQATTEWYTPAWVVDLARETMGGIDLDPASNEVAQGWIRAGTYYTATDLMSGLSRPWFGRVWLNPPFDDTPAWVARLEREVTMGDVTQAMLLVNSAPGYNWWEELWRQRPVCMLEKRLCFIKEDGQPAGQAKKGQTIAYFGQDYGRFARLWSKYGRIVFP